MQTILRSALLVALAGCGRFDFDARVDAAAIDPDVSVDVIGAGGPASCVGLAQTCGAGESCCASIAVPGGSFLRGYDAAADAMFPDMGFPATVSAFRLDTYEITVGRFRTFVEAGQGTQQMPPSQTTWDASWTASLASDTSALRAALSCDPTFQTWTDLPGLGEDRPINCITWYEAMAFCSWDGGFLPSELQSAYAAAGGDEQRAYPWSSPASSLAVTTADGSYMCLGDGVAACGDADVLDVGTRPAGNGRWGHADLGGNVWEWALDYYAPTYALPCADCAQTVNAGDARRMLRGGSYLDAEGQLRAQHRNPDPPEGRNAVVGARCARLP